MIRRIQKPRRTVFWQLADQPEHIPQVEWACIHENLMRFNADERGKERLKFLGNRCTQLQPHHSKVVALLEKLFHLTAEVCITVFKFLVVKADVCVARDREDAAFLHTVGVKQRRQPAQENVLRAHEARSVRQQQIGRHIVRHRNNANRLMPLLIFQQRRSIEVLVNQVRHRMIGAYEDRREHGQQLGLEKTVHLLKLSGIQRVRRNIAIWLRSSSSMTPL